ncbi:hypothetical protein FEZ48_02895 [Marinilactibacillus psychrotolerans]|uniref:Uncharacterized protein n=1 Tax=Marinilactibacillus psychrotolerans TaxID=191770 RepID=A0A5R9C6S8_9LACT|nr:hypothetical protein [Marinilactibacillus psychrotolerans]TLQ08849.1 hypothetical protein FEZ48_02895 [Marinilactibacillus psychrotolerans]
MNQYVAMIITALITGFVTWAGTKKNFKVALKEQDEKIRSNTTTEWKELYEAQVQEKNELKEEYKATRITLEEVKSKQFEMEMKLMKMEADREEEKEGYQIQIEQLTEENEELKEENTVLREENALLKGVKVNGKFNE